MLSCGVYGGRWVGSGLDPCPLASTAQLPGNLLPWTASTVRMSVISVRQTALLWKDYHSHLAQLNYSQSLPVQGTWQHEVACGQQTALGMQAWEKSPGIVRILTRVTTVKPLPLWENTRDGLRQKDNRSWPPFTSKAQMLPHPASFLLVSLFSLHLKTILSSVDVQVCWLAVQTQSATELWLKCSSVLSGRERPSPPTPTPGPVGQLKEEGKHLICLFDQGTSEMQLMSKPSGSQVVL